jgi:hypothetical protein
VISSSYPSKFRQFWTIFGHRVTIVKGSASNFSSPGQRDRARTPARKQLIGTAVRARCCCWVKNNNNNKNNRRSKIFLFAPDVSRIVNADNVHAMLWSEAGAHDVGNGNGDNPVQA